MRNSKSSRPFEAISGPTPEAMSAALDLLQVQEKAKREALAHVLRAAVCSFEMGRAFKQAYGSDHEALHQLRRLSEAAEILSRELRRVRPDLQLMLQNLVDPPYSRDDWNGMLDGLAKLCGVVSKAKSTNLSRRLPDRLLEQAIATLMLSLNDATGQRAHARAMDSRHDRPAELVSPEAQAIWLLLRHIDGITENIVANRIISLNRRYKGAALGDAFPYSTLFGGTIRHHTRPE